MKQRWVQENYARCVPRLSKLVRKSVAIVDTNSIDELAIFVVSLLMFVPMMNIRKMRVIMLDFSVAMSVCVPSTWREALMTMIVMTIIMPMLMFVFNGFMKVFVLMILSM